MLPINRLLKVETCSIVFNFEHNMGVTMLPTRASTILLVRLPFYRLIKQSAVVPPATHANIRDNQHLSVTAPEKIHTVERNG